MVPDPLHAGPQTFFSPAKLNLRLYVQGRKPNDYHELSLDFIPISLFDQLTFERAEHYSLECNLDFPTEENLVTKALKLLEKISKKTIPVKITLQKNIPSGAGLGGGSGNAACVLVVLNQLFSLGLTDQKLAELALELGADVPFFLNPTPSIATGLGEELTATPLESDLYFILYKPALSINTREAYQLCNHSKRQLTKDDFKLEQLKKITTSDNDFFGPLSNKYEELKEGKQRLETSEADAVGFSGSGSTLFALFTSKQKRDLAFGRLSPLCKTALYHVDSLKDYTYKNIL